MMKTKIYVLIVGLVLTCAVTYSQVSFGLKAGVNFQNLNGEKDDGSKYKNHLKPGFNAGVEVAFPVAEDFYAQTGLLFSTKGASDFNGVNDVSVSISYLELPIHVVYKPALGNGRLILGFGPYLAYGIAGKVKLNDNDEDINFTNDRPLLDPNVMSIKPLDAGADIFFGYEFPFKVSVLLNTQLGLINIWPKIDGENPDHPLKNTGFGVSLGYRF
jgi:hypothetical protein